MSDAKIGELNGPWAALLKVTVIVVPLCIPWFGWATVRILELSAFQTYGMMYVERQEKEAEALEKKVESLPPAEWRSRVTKLEDALEGVRSDVKQNMILLAKILTKIEGKP